MTSLPDPVLRRTARVLLIDAADRILLFQFRLDSSPTGNVWITPGGGLEPGENFESAAGRELQEATWLSDFELSACIWIRSLLVLFEDRTYDAHEHYFLCRVESHDLEAHVNPDEHERTLITDHRWWSVAEIEASTEVFAPRALAALLPPLLRGELPSAPIQMGA